MEEYMDVADVSRILKVSDKTVRRYVKEKRLQANRLGKGKAAHLRFTEGFVTKFLRDNETK